MQIVRCNMSMSIDGFISGPGHLDDGFNRVQDWLHQVFAWRENHGLEGGARGIDSDVFEAMYANIGAYVMGRGIQSSLECWAWIRRVTRLAERSAPRGRADSACAPRIRRGRTDRGS